MLDDAATLPLVLGMLKTFGRALGSSTGLLVGVRPGKLSTTASVLDVEDVAGKDAAWAPLAGTSVVEVKANEAGVDEADVAAAGVTELSEGPAGEAARQVGQVQVPLLLFRFHAV